MVNSISGVGFRGDTAAVSNQDLINAPGKYTTTAEIPADSFEKEGASKKSKKVGILATLAVALAAFAGLGYAVKSGKLTKVTDMPEGFFAKTWAHIKNAAHWVGNGAGKCWDTVAGWFGKGADDVAKAAEKAADDVAEAATK